MVVIIENYLNVIKHRSKRDTDKRIIYITNKAFKTNHKTHKMKLWFKYNIESNKETLLLAIENNVIYGTCTYSINQKDKPYYGKYCTTDTFMFLSDFTSVKKGVGKLLLNHVLDIAKSLSCDVILNAMNNDLIKYYKKHGFIQVSKYKNTMIKKDER